MTHIRRDSIINCGVFPNEILLLIKESIPDSDLRTHVCFYHVSRTTAGFYGDEGEQAEFWRRACLLSGICFLGHDTSYKDVAFEVIREDGFCTHPDCGGKLLDLNASAVAAAMDIFDWDPEMEPGEFNELDYYIEYDTEWAQPPEPVINRILSKLVFPETHPNAAAHSLSQTNPSPVLLRRQFQSTSVHPQTNMDRRLIERHPLVMRSMAIFPSTHRMSFRLGPDTHNQYPVERSPHVTVADMARMLSKCFDEELTIDRFLYLLGHVFSPLVQGGETFTLEDLSRHKTLRGLASQSRIDEILLVSGAHLYEEMGLFFQVNFTALPELTPEGDELSEPYRSPRRGVPMPDSDMSSDTTEDSQEEEEDQEEGEDEDGEGEEEEEEDQEVVYEVPVQVAPDASLLFGPWPWY